MAPVRFEVKFSIAAMTARSLCNGCNNQMFLSQESNTKNHFVGSSVVDDSAAFDHGRQFQLIFTSIRQHKQVDEKNSSASTIHMQTTR